MGCGASNSTHHERGRQEATQEEDGKRGGEPAAEAKASLDKIEKKAGGAAASLGSNPSATMTPCSHLTIRNNPPAHIALNASVSEIAGRLWEALAPRWADAVRNMGGLVASTHTWLHKHDITRTASEVVLGGSSSSGNVGTGSTDGPDGHDALLSVMWYVLAAANQLDALPGGGAYVGTCMSALQDAAVQHAESEVLQVSDELRSHMHPKHGLKDMFASLCTMQTKLFSVILVLAAEGPGTRKQHQHQHQAVSGSSVDDYVQQRARAPAVAETQPHIAKVAGKVGSVFSGFIGRVQHKMQQAKQSSPEDSLADLYRMHSGLVQWWTSPAGPVSLSHLPASGNQGTDEDGSTALRLRWEDALGAWGCFPDLVDAVVTRLKVPEARDSFLKQYLWSTQHPQDKWRTWLVTITVCALAVPKVADECEMLLLAAAETPVVTFRTGIKQAMAKIKSEALSPAHVSTSVWPSIIGRIEKRALQGSASSPQRNSPLKSTNANI